MMLVLHDDATREYAYGPALGLPDTEVGTFTQTLYDQGRNRSPPRNFYTVVMTSDAMRQNGQAFASTRFPTYRPN